ncbi:class I SAM-dependent methyltransferase [Pedobacter sp. KR3-3]|uniref:Class I SAM-dependent methyltransferase n=1 Tax=Pedobacter albus TaxID=3113905 RepID=A0ABU7I8Y3_9SPHI|nr:class I SAM-dependent methyltransferase [Pedobacter sp. KR3-3]MEE1945933.1 class I SAM-dependent methyltransferase [Pedobacter sp. KR3-3]
MALINPAIDSFYNQSSEETRLQLGLGPLEFVRNKELISRYLNGTKLAIADVGGGPGHYAAWLSGLGHEVTLIDPVQKHVQQAEKRAKKAKTPFKSLLGEAKKLPFADNSIDVVILHGPLYHIQNREERLAAIKEAKRVLKNGGVVLGFAITFAASTLAAFQSGMFHHPAVFDMCMAELSTSLHQPPKAFLGMLAEAYFHRPSALRNEFEACGLQVLNLVAVEGVIWMDKSFFESWATEAKRERLLQLLAQTEADQELLCLSPHMMLAAQKVGKNA